MALKLVTLDAGGTLLHSYPSVGEIYRNVTLEHGADVPADRFSNLMTSAYRECVRDHLHGGDDSDRELWRAVTGRVRSLLPALSAVPFEPWFESLYARFGRGDVWRLFDDSIEAVERLRRRGVTLGLISNWDTRLRGILKELGLIERLQIVKISAEAGERKPSPLMFEQAAREAGARPSESLHVGDLFAEDIRGALGAGWNAALLDRDGTHAPAPGYAVVRRLTDLVDLIG